MLAGGGTPDDGMAAIGSVVSEFAATTSDGTVLTPSSFIEPRLFGFFPPGCPPCDDLIPRFLASGTGRCWRS